MFLKYVSKHICFLSTFVFLLLKVTTSQSYNEFISCDQLNTVAGDTKIAITYAKIPFSIKKDGILILSCQKTSCYFSNDYKEILKCYCDLQNVSQKIIINVPHVSPNFTPVGNWSIETNDNNEITYTPKHICQVKSNVTHFACHYEDLCASILVVCTSNSGTIQPRVICQFWDTNNEIQLNVTIYYTSSECSTNITKNDFLNNLTQASLQVKLLQNITTLSDNETTLPIINTVQLNISNTSGTLCQEEWNQNRALFSTHQEFSTTSTAGTKTLQTTDTPPELNEDLTIYFSTIIVLSIVSSSLTIFLFIICLKRNFAVKDNSQHKIKKSKLCKQTEDIDNTDIYSINSLAHIKQKEVPIKLRQKIINDIDCESKKNNKDRDTLGSLPDHYCTIGRMSDYKKLATLKKSTRPTSDFDHYSSIDEILRDKEGDKLKEYITPENFIKSSKVIIIPDRSKDDLTTQCVSKRQTDGTLYEIIV